MEKKEIKARKKAYKKARSKATRPWKWLTWISAPLAIILTAATIIVGMFDNTFVLFLGGTFWELVNEDPNAIYFEGDFETEEERTAAGAALVKQVEAEGASLLMNEGDTLPLAKGAKVSLFSTSSVNIVYGGTGSANVDTSKCDNLKVALEKAGFEVNQTLWDFYETGAGAAYNRGAADATVQDSAQEQAKQEAEAEEGGSSGEWGSAEIVEAPWSEYTEDVINSVESYGDAAIVVLSRIGGEGADSYFDKTLGDGPNYLALNATEREMMQNIKALKDAGKIGKIIVLINTSNALQVDFLKNNEYGVDATMWIGGVGQTGLNAVAEIISGDINPSGSLPDTYYYDNYAQPAMKNFVPVTYEGDLTKIPEPAYTYMVYQEGIYVGYKYFETRYEDFVMGKGNAGDYKYNDEVAFPFGYGLSYTDFEYSDMSMVYDAEANTYTINVTVKNIGEKPGKETVQIYVNSPYTQYDIDNKVEKASVSLVGFDKTKILDKGESQTLTIVVDGDYVASYDAYGAGTYIMDAGDYYFTAATDSHNAVNNVLAAKGYTPENTDGRMDTTGNATVVCKWNNPELDTTTYATSDADTKIENQLNASDPNMNPEVGQTITYLTRNDWEGTMPSLEKTVKIMLNEYLIDRLNGVQYDPADYEQIEMPTLGADNGLTLYDMIGLDYDDPKWDQLLDQMTYEEMVAQIGDAFHWHYPMESVQAPGTRDENGPQGLTVTLFGSGLGVETTALTSEDVLAATFNKDLIYEIGNIVGNDCLDAGVTFLYGPGANTHRTPYGGRNFEYYSEDSFLSSETGRYEVSGIEKNGVYVVFKHFALNDSEQDRIGLGVWLSEQCAREIYLRAFQGGLEKSQGVIKNEAGEFVPSGKAGNGVMMAYTRWGTQWSGANTNLIKGIMNAEWECNGLQITDNILPDAAALAKGIDGVMGGTTTYDAMMSFYVISEGQDGSLANYENDPVAVAAMKEACHHNLFAIANSQAMNGIGPDTEIKAVEPSIITTCRTAAIVLWVLFAVSIVLWLTKRSKFLKTEEAVAYKEFKKSLKK